VILQISNYYVQRRVLRKLSSFYPVILRGDWAKYPAPRVKGRNEENMKNKEMEIKFSIQEGIKYQITEHHDNDWKTESGYLPLPWGEMQVENVTISGTPWSSHGGAWYWKLPDFCIMGYGPYSPWVKFRFTGTIVITNERDFPYPFKLGWRQDDSKWVYLNGKLSPCDEYITEKGFKKLFSYFEKLKMVKDNEYLIECSQGHLRGKYYPVISDSITDNEKYLKIISSRFSRRKIFNHQFFGKNIQILYIDKEIWAVIAPEGGNVVSPDHLDEPIHIEKGITIFTHPFPDDDDID